PRPDNVVSPVQEARAPHRANRTLSWARDRGRRQRSQCGPTRWRRGTRRPLRYGQCTRAVRPVHAQPGAAPGDGHIVKQETVAQFTQIAVPARRGVSARTLGWEALPTGEETSSAGTLLGPHT